MNKAVVVGISIIVIISIIGITYSASSNDPVETNLIEVEDELNLDATVPVEEDLVSDESSQTGRELSVELTESIGVKSP